MPPYAGRKLGPAAVEWCGPHTCPRCLKAGHPATWHHVRVVGRVCPIPALADCLDCRMVDVTGALGRTAA